MGRINRPIRSYTITLNENGVDTIVGLEPGTTAIKTFSILTKSIERRLEHYEGVKKEETADSFIWEIPESTRTPQGYKITLKIEEKLWNQI